jgi:hypothetical protein
MHRSGTSLTASLLEKSGLKIGENLMSNGFDNKKGHFEDLELLKIHEEDLRAKSLDTRGLSGKIQSHFHFEQRTLDIIDNLIKSKKHLSLWGWKEPRTTLYLEAWKTILPDVKSIAVFRHYDEVADSLIRRYKHKLLKGVSMSSMVRMKHFIIYPIHIFIIKRDAYKSWYIYNKAILDFKEKYPDDMIILELNHFTRNYNQILETINAKFALELSKIHVADIVDHSLLTKVNNRSYKMRFFSLKRLNQILTALNKKSIWI